MENEILGRIEITQVLSPSQWAVTLDGGRQFLRIYLDGAVVTIDTPGNISREEAAQMYGLPLEDGE